MRRRRPSNLNPVEVLGEVAAKGLALVTADGDANFLHHAHSLGADRSRLRPRTADVKSVASHHAEQTIRPSGSAPSCGAEEKDSLLHH